MIAYTGASEKSIERYATWYTRRFYLIKDINGNFWNEYIDMLNIFSRRGLYDVCKYRY